MTRRTRSSFPTMTVALMASILVAYAVELASGDGMALAERFGFVAAHPSLGSALSSLWLHDPEHVGHLLGNVVALLFVGVVIESELGSIPFAALYLLSGIGGCAVHWVADPSSTTALVGASGSIAGVLVVLGALRPRLVGFAAGFVAWNVWLAWSGTGGAVSAACHCGGAAIGVVFAVVARLRGVELRLRATT